MHPELNNFQKKIFFALDNGFFWVILLLMRFNKSALLQPDIFFTRLLNRVNKHLSNEGYL